jgi:hypothetical protein
LRDLVPLLNFPQPSITDGTDAIRPATLRGLGPDQTLVLINGKRRHVAALLNINGSIGRGSTAVDVNQIPASALGRVEVLRDGAAAQNGSDAIAGVINFQLNDARKGGRSFVNYGGFNICWKRLTSAKTALRCVRSCSGSARQHRTALRGSSGSGPRTSLVQQKATASCFEILLISA